ncbi:MAG: hypothetical protein HY297_04705 [Thaumarchaeota archaeon]|nr:hypothetical protein [Nitrososphaerota archaeon]
MADPFAPQFLILLGIDIFLGGSILTAMLDDAFPDAMPYILDFGSLIGLSQLLMGPQYLAGFSIEIQFFYSTGYAVISLSSVIGLNMYLYFLKKRHIAGIIFAMVGTIPSFLITSFFISAFINGVPVTLPDFPLISWDFVYFGLAVSTILLLLGLFYTVTRRSKVD